MTPSTFIEKYRPCAKGAAFAHKYATMHDVWNALANGEGDLSWLVWLASRDGLVDRKVLVRATCKAVRTAPIGDKTLLETLADERSRNAVVVAEQWVDGRATLDDVRKATDDAYAAAHAAHAAYAAYAAHAAAYAAAYAADADAYAVYAAYAADNAAAAYDAAYDDAARAAVYKHFRKTFAEMVPNPFIKE